jgi:hypothetical protein
VSPPWPGHSGRGSSPIATVRSYLASGFNAGGWDGSGLASLAAHIDGTARTGLGYAENSALNFATFNGQSVDSTSVLVKYTYYGTAIWTGW